MPIRRCILSVFPPPNFQYYFSKHCLFNRDRKLSGILDRHSRPKLGNSRLSKLPGFFWNYRLSRLPDFSGIHDISRTAKNIGTELAECQDRDGEFYFLILLPKCLVFTYPYKLLKYLIESILTCVKSVHIVPELNK